MRAGPTGEGCGPRGEILGSRFTHHPNDRINSDARTDARRGERSGDVVNCGANPPPRANERESESEKEKKIVRERADATNSLAVTPMCASNAAIVRSRLHQDAWPRRGRPGRPRQRARARAVEARSAIRPRRRAREHRAAIVRSRRSIIVQQHAAVTEARPAHTLRFSGCPPGHGHCY